MLIVQSQKSINPSQYIKLQKSSRSKMEPDGLCLHFFKGNFNDSRAKSV